MTSDTKQPDEGILRKIKKCLALATSSNPAEAEAAMRQAQKLMAAHGVDEGGLARAEITNQRVQGTRGINPTPWENRLAHLCCRAFGAKLLWAKGPKGGQGNADNGWWTFVAPKSHVELVIYTFTVPSRQVLKARADFIAGMGSERYYMARVEKAAEADAFCDAFVAQLGSKISDAYLDPKVAAALEERHLALRGGGKAKVKGNGAGSLAAALLGAAAGQNAHFHAATTKGADLKKLGHG